MLPSLNHNQQNRHRLEGLADAAICLQEPGIYSPSSSPSSPDFQEYTFGKYSTTTASRVCSHSCAYQLQGTPSRPQMNRNHMGYPPSRACSPLRMGNDHAAMGSTPRGLSLASGG